jgi:hypothetical protein
MLIYLFLGDLFRRKRLGFLSLEGADFEESVFVDYGLFRPEMNFGTMDIT